MSKIASAVALAACLVTTAAQADSVLFSGFADGSELVTVTTPVRNGTILAGGLATSLNGGPSFTSYCIDLANSINFGTTYTDYSQVTGASYFALDPGAYADLRRLFSIAPNPIGATMEAAFQIVVWEIIYETGATYNLGMGSASFSASAGATTQANAYLTALASFAGSGPMLNVLDSNGGHQDVIYAPIPEPETYAMMLAGLAVLGSLARRRGVARKSNGKAVA